MTSTLVAPAAIAADPIAVAAHAGLTASPKTLPPWLFYDAAGSELFEQITQLPEYYLTRTERALFERHADEIIAEAADGKTLAILELGAGTATKTGILLAAGLRQQPSLVYQPIDVSASALEAACASLEQQLPRLIVQPQLCNYTSDPLEVRRPANTRILALYIGSSIGNFTPAEAVEILANLRAQLEPGDTLLLGTDLAPRSETTGAGKSVDDLLAAYDDARGITAAFNRNILHRLNRDLGTDFNVLQFAHRAIWNAAESRIEMHLESLTEQIVHLPLSGESYALALHFASGETIHTENSYKFTPASIKAILAPAGFAPTSRFEDPDHLFAVTIAEAI